jgi:hypothetical protein
MAGTGDRPEDSPMEPDDINSRLAEIAAELASEAQFKEPSAAERARARAAAAAKKAPAPARGGRLHRWHVRKSRASRKAEKLREPVRAPGAPEPVRQRSSRRARRAQRAAWKAGHPAADRGYSDSDHPSTRKSVLTVIVIIALLVGASIGLRTLLDRKPSAGSPGPAADISPTSSPRTASASPVPTAAAAAFDPLAPFQGTPAVNWSAGALGIVTPAPRGYGQFSAGQVRAAYATVRALLIAGNLSPTVLAGGPPTAFARLLATAQRATFEKDLGKNGVSKDGDQLSTRAWVTSFTPGSTHAVGTVIKVHGSMTARAARYDHRATLRVHADYLFVYPVSPPGNPAAGLRVVRRVDMNVEFAPWNEPASSQLVPWISSILGGPAGVLCDIRDGFDTPAFSTGPAQQVRPSGQPVNPYDLAIAPPASGGCQATTGT